MNPHSLKLANYWRTSLADAENGKGALSSSHLATLTALPVDALLGGCIGPELVEAVFTGEPGDVSSVEVTLRPFAYWPRLEHGKARSTPVAAITPVVSHVLITRDGRLYPTAKTLVPRDILEPQATGALVLGDQAELDDFLSRHDVPVFAPPTEAPVASEHAAQWTAYLQFCAKLFQHVARDWLPAQDGFQVADTGYLFKEAKPEGFTKHIVPLYDHLRANQPDAPLFERFAQCKPSADEPCLAPNSQFAARLAHAGDRYALAPAQRDALAHVMAGQDVDVLAVNGPPGTGKTTLLLSVVASLWARAALAGGEPPVIVASSTNNQAVTNIIKAFGKDFSHGTGPFAGRWLPDIDSFGAYFPSFSKEGEMARSYQTKSFFAQRESDQYLEHAQAAYTAAAAVAFPGETNIASIVDKLQAALRTKQQQLHTIEHSWSQLQRARQDLTELLGEQPGAALTQLQTQQVDQAAHLQHTQARHKQFKHYLANEPLLYTLFSWLPPVATKRLRLAKLHLEQQATDPALQDAPSVSAIEDQLNLAVTHSARALKELETKIHRAQTLFQAEQQYIAHWDASLAPLPRPAGTPAESIRLGDCDPWADTSLRFDIFLLTTHYWEGRWLLEVADTLPEIIASRKKNGRRAIAKNWHRWMKLTPCVVATFFMLPKEMKCKGKDYVDDYALNFIDLLIVDEAGQVLPEVAAPSFALAKQALVIGDTLQIEPIWSIPRAVDIGNLLQADLLAREHVEDDYQAFSASGRSAASGSVMAIAQSASRYHYDPDMARGMFLYEHRRCYNAIIEYCNALCYKGKLIPSRVDQPEAGLPPLGYLHIDGRCQPGNGGSRHNVLEARTIAAWIQANEAELLQRYEGKALWEILGVITPFGAQTHAISQACSALGIKAGKGDGDITVGTVHSFQGAERPVVIFSAVYSKHADGGFIDRRDSMLNVAVSRAKDSFLVFGDMDAFGQVPASKPRGLLAQFLLRDPASELKFDYQPREDLQTARTGVQHLHQFEEHDRFLATTLQTARQQVQIVTPWVKLGWMEKSGAMAEMAASVARGVQVAVYTDYGFNADITHKQPQGDPARIAAFHTAIAALRALNIQANAVSKVHSKIVMADDQLLCIGSFNWLSASRDGRYANHETSMVYCGPDVTGELLTHRASLAARVLTRH